MSKTLSDFKALLFDVDSTLTNSKRVVTPATQAAIAKLVEKKYRIGLCTGRHSAVLKKQALGYFPAESIHITCGGAQVIKNDGSVLWQKTLPIELCQEIQAKANKAGMGTNQPNGDFYYANAVMLQRYAQKEHLSHAIRPIEEITDWNVPVLVVTEVTDDFLKYLDTLPEISYKYGRTSIDTPYVDITPVGVNKALGIMEWSKITGVSPSETIGFGDAGNDIEFLSVVGFSIAMGNATEEIKTLANRVIGHTDDDGLAVYLEQLLEGAAV